MDKLASQARLCYNEGVNIVVSEGATNTTQTLIHSMEECIMDTLPLHVQSDKTTFIYALRDPETNKICYVGKSNDPHLRLRQHRLGSTRLRSQKDRWLNSLYRKDLSPVLEIVEEVLIEQWEERERYWIAYYREQESSLTNVFEGGSRSQKTLYKTQNVQSLRETSKAKAAFFDYVSMGPDRSLGKLVQMYGKRHGYIRQLEHWSSDFDWVARAVAYDAEHFSKRRFNQEQAIFENDKVRAFGRHIMPSSVTVEIIQNGYRYRGIAYLVEDTDE